MSRPKPSPPSRGRPKRSPKTCSTALSIGTGRLSSCGVRNRNLGSGFNLFGVPFAPQPRKTWSPTNRHFYRKVLSWGTPSESMFIWGCSRELEIRLKPLAGMPLCSPRLGLLYRKNKLLESSIFCLHNTEKHGGDRRQRPRGTSKEPSQNLGVVSLLGGGDTGHGDPLGPSGFCASG